MIHNFQASLEKSQNPEHEAFWQECYRNEWGDELIGAFSTGINPSQWQTSGVDRVILLRNGNFYYVDEKLREVDYGDLLVEWASVAHRDGADWRVEKIGWTLDSTKVSDFICYGVPSAGKYWLLPYHAMRCAAGANIEAWKRQFKPVVAHNRGYCTLSVAVPWQVFSAEVASTMKRELRIAKTPTVKKLLRPSKKGGAAA